MSDPANIIVRDLNKKADLVTIYDHYGKWPDGKIRELAKYLSDMRIGNGIPGGMRDCSKFANGPGCLAAKVVSFLKDMNDAGGIYLETSANEAIRYIIEADYNNINMTVIVYGSIVFKGTPKEYYERGFSVVDKEIWGNN